MAEEVIRTYLVALQKGRMLFPASAAAEIIPYEPLQRIEGTPDWFLGILGWRGLRVPVVAFESLAGNRGSFSLVSVASTSLIIVRTLRTRESIPFYAIVSQSRPELIEVGPGLMGDINEDLDDNEIARAKIGGTVLSIPDLEFIEASLNELEIF